MAFANADYSDVLATTIENRSGSAADNFTNHNAALSYMKKRGNVRPFSGGSVILEEIMYADPNTSLAQAYTGAEVLDVSDTNNVSAAKFDIKQYASRVVMTGLESLQNASEEAIVDLMDAKLKAAYADLYNMIDVDMYGDGTGRGGKALVGFDAMIKSTGVYGGINRGNYAFWRSFELGLAAASLPAASATNIQTYMTRCAIRTMRGNDSVDLILGDENFFSLYNQSMVAIQRVMSDGDKEGAGGGFPALKFFGGGVRANVVMAGGIGSTMPDNTMYFVNTGFTHFRPHAQRNFRAIGGDRQSVNQDVIVKLIGFAGALTSSGPRFCARLTA